MTKYFIELTEQQFEAEIEERQRELLRITLEIQTKISTLDSTSILLSDNELAQLENMFKTHVQKNKALNIYFRYVELKGDDFIKSQKYFPPKSPSFLLSHKTSPTFIPWTYVEIAFNSFPKENVKVNFFLNREDDYWFVVLGGTRHAGFRGENIPTTWFRCDGFYALLKLFEYKIFPLSDSLYKN